MKIESLNDDYKNWFEKANGFLEAYTLVFNEWDLWFRRGFTHQQIRNLIEPQNFLFIHTVELYLKAFLILKGKTAQELKSKKFGHQLNVLREACVQYDEKFFTSDDIKYIDMCAGSVKNFYGSKYPEGGASSSLNDLVLLRKIKSYVEYNIIEIENKEKGR